MGHGMDGAGSLKHEEKALLRRLLAGDEEAFEAFFEGYFHRLYRFALGRLGGNEAAAQEVVQESLMKAIEKLETFRGESALFTWLCGICRYEVSAFLRQEGRRREQATWLEDSPEIHRLLENLASGDGPEAVLQRREATRLVHLTLDHLPLRYGQALEWKYLEGVSVVEIGERLGVGMKAAESILSRARVSFRSAFEGLCKGLDGRGFRGLRLARGEEQ